VPAPFFKSCDEAPIFIHIPLDRGCTG
jgi:hypothetical protein